MKVLSLIREYLELTNEIADIDKTLVKIRGKEWKRGVENDTRLSVSMLYKLYLETTGKLDSLLQMQVEEVNEYVD